METQIVENEFEHTALIIENDEEPTNNRPRIHFPAADIINCLTNLEESYPQKIRSLEPLVTRYVKKLKGIPRFLFSEKIYKARRERIIPHLCDTNNPAIVECEILRNAINKGHQFKDPIPYAIWAYTREDFRRNIFFVYDGKGNLILTKEDGVAFTPNKVLEFMNEAGAFSREHWEYILKFHKMKGTILENGVFVSATNDDRFFRGWDTLLVRMNNQYFKLGGNEKQPGIIPGYYRDSKSKVPPELLSQLSLLEDAESAAIIPYVEKEKKSKPEKEFHYFKKPKELQAIKDTLESESDTEVADILSEVDSQSNTTDNAYGRFAPKLNVIQMFLKRRNEVEHLQNQLFRKISQTNDPERLHWMLEFSQMIEGTDVESFITPPNKKLKQLTM